MVAIVLASCSKDTVSEGGVSVKSPEEVLASYEARKTADKTLEAIDFLNNHLENDALAYAPGAGGSQAMRLPSKYSSKTIDTTYDFDLKGKKMLRLVVFKPSGYLLLSTIKKVPITITFLKCL